MARGKGSPGGHHHGVLVVDKPQGMTSHDVVSHVRKAYKTRRVGHAGTLDPMATGVVVLLLGEATKLSSVLTTQSKEYVATVTFGEATDTLDAEGKTTSRRPLPPGGLSRETLEGALLEERARTLQIPPAVSAIKVEGQRAYRLARSGADPQLSPRPVQIHELRVADLGRDWAKLTLKVSKGYYVRALARDLAANLNTVGHLSSLRRIRSGSFDLDEANPLPLRDLPRLLPLKVAAQRSVPTLTITKEGSELLRQGKRLEPEFLTSPPPEQPAPVLAALHDEHLIALVEPVAGSNLFKVRRGISDPGPR